MGRQFVNSTATIAGVGTALPPSAVQDELWDKYFAQRYAKLFHLQAARFGS